MGVEVTGRDLVAVVVRLPDAGTRGAERRAALRPASRGGPSAVLDVAEAMAGACRAAGVPALVGALDDVRAGALLSLPPGADDDKQLRDLGPACGARCGGRAARRTHAGAGDRGQPARRVAPRGAGGVP